MTTRTWEIKTKKATDYKCIAKVYDWSTDSDVRIIKLLITDENTITIEITRNTFDDCEMELKGQINDGFFENLSGISAKEITK